MESLRHEHAATAMQKSRLVVHMGDQTEDLLKLMSSKVPSNQKIVLAMLPQIAGILIMEIGLPLGLYFGLRQPTGPLSPVWALLIAGCPPLAMVLLKLVTKFRIDGVGLLAVTAFAAAAIVAGATQNARILLLEKSIVTGAIGIVFVLSLVPFRWTWKGRLHRILPITYILVAQFLAVDLMYEEVVDGQPVSSFGTFPSSASPAPVAAETDYHGEDVEYLADDHAAIRMTDLAASAGMDSAHDPKQTETNSRGQQKKRSRWSFGFEKVELPLFKFMYNEIPSFRRVCILITAIWGVGFLIELAVRLAMIFTIADFDRVFLYSNIVFIVVLVLCAVLTSAASLMSHFRCLRELNQYLLEGPR